MTTRKAPRNLGRRTRWTYPIYVPVKLEGNIVKAIDAAIDRHVENCHWRTDVIALAVADWLEKHEIAIPTVAEGNPLARKGGSRPKLTA
jgi:hypothetical protein